MRAYKLDKTQLTSLFNCNKSELNLLITNYQTNIKNFELYLYTIMLVPINIVAI